MTEQYYTITNRKTNVLSSISEWEPVYFATIDGLHNMVWYGETIRKINSPPSSYKYTMCKGVYSTTKLDLGESYCIFDPVNIEKFKLYLAIKIFINKCVSAEKVETLKFLKNSNYNFCWTHESAGLMVKHNDCDALNWIKESKEYYIITNYKKDGLLKSTSNWDKLYFTPMDEVYKLLEYNYGGTIIRKVHLPDYPNFEMGRNRYRDVYYANMLNLGKSYCMFDPVNIKNFKLYLACDKLIDRCVNYNKIETLEFLEKSSYEFCWTVKCVSFMLDYKNRDALVWFRKTGRKVKNDCYIVEKLAEMGDVETLKWLATAAYPNFKYNILAVNYAAKNGHINVLDWFNSSGLEFKYGCGAINGAVGNGHINVLEWFRKNKLYRLKYGSMATVVAAKCGYLDVLKWLLNNNMFKYDKRAIYYAKRNGHNDVLEWFDRLASIEKESNANHVSELQHVI